MLIKKPSIAQIYTTLLKMTLMMGIFSIISCVSKQYPEQTTSSAIEFGHGGGFAGIEYSYTLLNDGRLFANKEQKMFVSKLSTNQAKQLFKNIDILYEQNVQFNSPGNTYQYIQWKNGDNHRRWVWNSSNQPNLDPQLKINYSILTSFVNKFESTEAQ